MTAKWSFSTRTIDEEVSEADNTISLLSGVVRVSPGSRLFDYRKVIAEYVAGDVPIESKRAQLVYRALTELSALSVIARGLATGNPSQKVRDLLSQIIGGQALPDHEKKSLARNTQLHLYVAAILKASGIRVEFEEPDLLAHIHRRIIGVAAKRITSLKQLEKRISEGKAQLKRAKKRGIVWIEITDAMHEYSGLYVFDDVHTLNEHQKDMEDHAYQAVGELRPRISKSTHLADVTLSWIAPRTVSGSGSFETAEFLLPFGLYQAETIEGEVARMLYERVEAGLRELGQLH